MAKRTATFFKYVWPFFNVMHESVKKSLLVHFNPQNVSVKHLQQRLMIVIWSDGHRQY